MVTSQQEGPNSVLEGPVQLGFQACQSVSGVVYPQNTCLDCGPSRTGFGHPCFRDYTVPGCECVVLLRAVNVEMIKFRHKYLIIYSICQFPVKRLLFPVTVTGDAGVQEAGMPLDSHCGRQTRQ